MQGVVIAYMLTVALLIPASGWTIAGSRRIFVAAIVLFSWVRCLARCPPFNQLVASRVLQALGGALMLPVGLVVLRAFAQRIRADHGLHRVAGAGRPLLGRPWAAGWWSTPPGTGSSDQPAGGRDRLHRRAALHAGSQGPERVRFDTLGFVLFGAAMVLITIAPEGLGEMHMPHAR